MSRTAGLYDQDFYAWTQDQAAALRAWPERLWPNAIDIGHIAEEVEDLGSSQRNAAKGLLRQILVHLLKLRFHPDRLPAAHWREEVREFRAQLDDIFAASPSLRARRAELVAPVWRQAARAVAGRLDDEGHAAAAAELRRYVAEDGYFDLDREALDPDWLPEHRCGPSLA
jgi:hypothetical protein